MKRTFEVSWSVFKQYMARGDGPIFALEDEENIKIFQTVGEYEICFLYPKGDTESTLIFKHEYLDRNPRVIYPLREIKKTQRIMEEDDENSYTRPGAEELGLYIRSKEDQGSGSDESDSD